MVTEGGFEDRKVVPPLIESYKNTLYEYHLQLGKKSDPENKLYVIKNILPITVTSAQDPSTPSSHTNTVTIPAESDTTQKSVHLSDTQ